MRTEKEISFFYGIFNYLIRVGRHNRRTIAGAGVYSEDILETWHIPYKEFRIIAFRRCLSNGRVYLEVIHGQIPPFHYDIGRVNSGFLVLEKIPGVLKSEIYSYRTTMFDSMEQTFFDEIYSSIKGKGNIRTIKT